jgi:hypothetical protein
MNKPALLLAELKIAVQAALDGDWDKSHNIAQDYSDPMANWIHAVLHKIEGDVWNSKYWYARTMGKSYEDFSEAIEELKVIQNCLK